MNECINKKILYNHENKILMIRKKIPTIANYDMTREGNLYCYHTVVFCFRVQRYNHFYSCQWAGKRFKDN